MDRHLYIFVLPQYKLCDLSPGHKIIHLCHYVIHTRHHSYSIFNLMPMGKLGSHKYGGIILPIS